jgi:hypothetical protein
MFSARRSEHPYVAGYPTTAPAGLSYGKRWRPKVFRRYRQDYVFTMPVGDYDAKLTAAGMIPA